MAFDKPTRNRLASFAAEARGLIADEFTQQFQSLYGISDKGTITPLDQLGHLDDAGLATAALLRERIDYLIKTHPDDREGHKAAVARLAREQAFTILNRLAAILMAEKRGLIAESVGKGYLSKGFKVFEQVAGSGLGDTYERYRRYLFCLFDELAVDLGVLFDRRSPQGLLFPRELTLLALLPLLNGPDLDPLWIEDETIGWIYQYYNDPAERKKMRELSAAPRNSRELAVRNQFFTPRYVVEFLTDNTLGRIWYEMTKGETRLAEQCRYLVRRSTEIFLKPEESAPLTQSQEGLSQEELLQQPVYIAHRALKDPRELRMLDPACGSMHFGLYAFDLYEVIYAEAWGRGVEALRVDFPDKENFLREVPRLIIEHNIHGIDIDPRAVQIAGLSLWLRAQKSWQEQHVSAIQRPRILHSNLVCAEPMPGDKEMLREFVASQFDAAEQPAFTFLLERVFDCMILAGEAGSLLKIEAEISGAVSEAKSLWKRGPQYEQGNLFAGALPKNPEQLRLDLSGISDERFWETAEDRIYAALRAYAEQAESDGYQRRLFAEDAARGFAFIDLCRRRYDVVVMNPPFGEGSQRANVYLKRQYGFGRPDVYMCFVFRADQILISGGRSGAITSRTFLTLQFFDPLRELLLQGSLRLDSLLDLGGGVLDGATVETCAYVSEKLPSYRPILFFNLLDHQLTDALPEEIQSVKHSGSPPNLYAKLPSDLAVIPGKVFAYRIVPGVLRSFAIYTPLDSAFCMEQAGKQKPAHLNFNVRQGLIPGDQFRFCRLWHEIPAFSTAWHWAAKGGNYSKYVSREDLLITWEGSGAEMKAFAEENYGGASRTIKNEQFFFRPGLSFPRVSSVGFNARVLPSNYVFTDTGMAIISDGTEDCLSLLGFLNSRLADYCCKSLHPGRKFEIAHISSLPINGQMLSSAKLRNISIESIALVRSLFSLEEDKIEFFLPEFIQTSLSQEATSQYFGKFPGKELAIKKLAQLQDQLNLFVFDEYGISGEERSIIALDLQDGQSSESFAQHLSETARAFLSPESCPCLQDPSPGSALYELGQELISYLIGTVFGRWDILFSTGEKPAPDLSDPFAPLPICPPGMLQNAEGLPADQYEVPTDYPLRITWSGILVDDENHPEDIVARVQETFKVIWNNRADTIEHKTCEQLGVKTLRDYFRKPSGFFADHFKRYTKSRRQTPIYWPISTAKGSYTLWLYYHRLTDQTLHIALADFVAPKLKDVRAEICIMRESSANNTRQEELLDLENELIDFHAEIERIIKLPWKPNLNDGVLITACPLWKLFRLPKWQKDLKACWEKLEKGDYDWAHLAYSIWPKRIEEACKKDRSIAIAHNLEHLCQVEPPKPKAKRGKKAA